MAKSTRQAWRGAIAAVIVVALSVPLALEAAELPITKNSPIQDF
jgi:hypothetical protein